MKREFRTIRCAELRAKQGDKPGIEGYAAVFNERSEQLGWFREVIMPGAFSRALKEKQDVRALINHDPNRVIGRTKSGTLELKEDSKGLRFSVDLPGTQDARDLMELVNRGDMDGCSFGFTAVQQKWAEEKDPDDATRMLHVRELHDVDLFDVSAVTFPAYPQTSVDARSLWPDGAPEDVTEHVPEAREKRANEKKTKKVAGADLSADCFAYVGDESDTSTWKLPIKFPGDDEKTKSHIRNAMARFNETKGIPADKKAGVWRKIAAAAKKQGIKVSDQDSLRALRWIETDTETRSEMCACGCQECQDGDCANCSNDDCQDENCDHGERSQVVTEDDRARMIAECDVAKI